MKPDLISRRSFLSVVGAVGAAAALFPALPLPQLLPRLLARASSSSSSPLPP